MKPAYHHIVLVLMVVLAVFFHPGKEVKGQFYNGHQMTFGKSRVQYNDFYWQYIRYPKFDVYFYVNGRNLADYIADVANSELEMMEYSVEEFLQHRIIFIAYNKQSEFRQSNIGLVSGNDDYNIGGVMRVIDNKVFVYYEGDHVKLRRQIKASLAQVLINEMMYGGNLRERVSSSVSVNLPEWYVNGLISYLAYDDDFTVEEKIKEIILKEKCQKIHRLQGEDATIAGHAFWRYISETYGPQIIPQIIYMARVSKNLESGFLYVLGIPLKEIINDWFYYYQARYQDELQTRQDKPLDAKPIVKKPRKNRVYNQVKASPDGRYIAYTTNQDGRYKIFLYDSKEDKSRCLYRKENKLEQIVDYSYPILAWHPLGNVLTWMRETNGHIWFDMYRTDTREVQHREIFYLDKVLDYAYSPDGLELVLSAVENGYTDIFVYSIAASTFKRITHDIADDLHPRFIDGSERIIFSSNRNTDSLEFEKDKQPSINNNFDIWIYNYKNPENHLTRLTNTNRTDELMPQEYNHQKYLYVTDANGIMNDGYISIDSSISFIDTAIHYRKFTRQYLLSNSKFGISTFEYNPNTNHFTEAFKEVKRYSLFTAPLDLSKQPIPEEVTNTWFRNYLFEKSFQDSVERIEAAKITKADSIIDKQQSILQDSLIDITNYVFEVEKEAALEFLKETDNTDTKTSPPKQFIYTTNFYSNLLVTQVDFGFMNQSYQTFTGGPFYYNPGLTALLKIGAIDIFEDYKITGGIRFSMDLSSSEYLLSVEDLKNRFDKQYIYHRLVFESYKGLGNYYYLVKVYTNEFMTVIRYPFSQIQCLKGTATFRYDQEVTKSVDDKSLGDPDQHAFWGGLKGEYIIDNTRKIDLNLFDGFRAKLFLEYYGNINHSGQSHLFVTGFDARYYWPVYRGVTFASRLAGSTSFGKSLLIYYLGGVDNWMNFSQTTPTFDRSTRIDDKKNWAFQASATNMRGFVQNVRNGNSFAVANMELRWPIIRFLYNRPVNSDFLNNLMLIGFTDFGSAWEGFNPLNANNAYDKEEIINGPVTVIIDRKKSPIVMGYGFGLRTRLLGYYVRTDWAWGVDGGRVLPKVFYLSLCTDF